MTKKDATLLTTPLCDLEDFSEVRSAFDRRDAIVREENRNFKGSYHAPFIISDDLGVKGVLNPADGKTYDSKSAYYAAIKSSGCEIVGNDAQKERKKELCDNQRKRDIARTMEQLGY